jgi:ATP adenylyltransferase
MNDLNAADEFEPHRYLSAPWRMRYLSKSRVAPGCVFCQKLASDDDVDNLVLWRGESIAIVMNLYPYSTGHVMQLPYEHIASPEQLEEPQIMAEIATEIPKTMRALRRVLDCQGFNTGMNTGGAAGAGIADHMHMHVVPRWNGDANFMPIIGNVTVMPEALSVTYARLRAELVVEHDELRALSALVLSADRSQVLVRDDTAGSIYSTLTDHQHSLVRSMGAQLAVIGIDASPVGWVGNDTVVWQASSESDPVEGRWAGISELPPIIAPLADEALRRLGAGEI